MKRILIIALALASVCATAQQKGSITPEMLGQIEQGYAGTASDKAIRNALNTASVAVLAANADNAAMIDTEFSDRVRTVGITDQKSSGRSGSSPGSMS